MKFLKWLGIVLLLLILVYFLGPKPAMPKLSDELPVVPSQPAGLEKFIQDEEAQHKLKPDNEARIIWLNDSLKQPTE
ncbi:MAG: alpha/beta hydrolase, partial [Bacteroidia bacterium]|nr:alpha/beta hydrolase [Bacteroidia bacterium]